MAVRGIRFVVRNKVDLPRVGCRLGDDEGERRFRKLHKTASIRIDRDEQFTGDLRGVFFIAPNGLALADVPSGFTEIDGRQRGNGLTARQTQHKYHEHQPGEKPKSVRIFFEHFLSNLSKSTSDAMAVYETTGTMTMTCKKQVYNRA